MGEFGGLIALVVFGVLAFFGVKCAREEAKATGREDAQRDQAKAAQKVTAELVRTDSKADAKAKERIAAADAALETRLARADEDLEQILADVNDRHSN